MRRPPFDRLSRPLPAFIGVVLAVAVVAAVAILLPPAEDGPRPVQFDAPTQAPTAVPIPPVSDATLRRLPAATTDTTLRAAPLDRRPAQGGTSVVVHNRRPMPVFAAPGGRPFARLPPQQLGGDTWLPVIAGQPNWVQVLLPSRPNRATGWLATTTVTFARIDDEVHVNLHTGRLHLLNRGRTVGQWPISAGTAGTPTPTGRTFVLAVITDPRQPFSPLIWALGTHSAALDTYAGGPGTVGIHGWNRSTVTGRPASHGCIRVPPAAMRALRGIAVGTPVRIDAR